MRHFWGILLLVCSIFLACESPAPKQSTSTTNSKSVSVYRADHVNNDYNLHLASESKALLVLFPGGGNVGENIKEEFKILDLSTVSKISVAMMNFNRHLWIIEEEAEQLAMVLQELVKTHGLQGLPIYIGGMSIGGNVALSLSNHLHKQHPTLAPKGVFIVDSPIDLHRLYENAQVDLSKEGLTEDRLAEPRWIAQTLENAFGKGDELLANIAQKAPFTLANQATSVSNLKQTQLRLYTEPDPEWWHTNRGTAHEQTNAYMIQNIHQWLIKEGWDQVELVQTKNKGYRANGDRHPHSWSIVNVSGLLEWIYEGIKE